MAACRSAKKPVVVSQGDVAASGGYLISVESDRLLTTPLTITGSIGVIAAWVWDEGLGTKTGVSADGVQRGSHADLFAGLRVPVIGVRLPTRGLREDERARAKETILEHYDQFVSRVATARHRTEEEIEEVAQGRVWMGQDAILRGLCDDVGGLLDAADGAALRAGISPEDEYTIEEYPPRRRFSLPGALEHITSARGETPRPAREDWSVRALRLFAESGGAPLLLLPPDALPGDWDPAP
jgi:protease-4